MTEFTLSIAGYTARITCLFASTRDYCAAYLTEAPPEFAICVTPELLRLEQALLDMEADEEGLRRRVFPDPFLERNAIQRLLGEKLLSRDVLLLHGSCVAVDGYAYLFTAKCGTGKSTHTRYWREVFGSRAVMVNDDKPFLCFGEDGIYACGSPWSGKHGLHSNITVPLKGICILERGSENTIRPMLPEEALPLLLHQSNAPEDPQLQLHCHALVDKLTNSVPLWQMACTKDPSAAIAAHVAMAP